MYYPTWRAKGSGVARKILEDIKQFSPEMVDVDFELTRIAAELRPDHKLPCTDCFAAALAARRKASLTTSDKDFAYVDKKNGRAGNGKRYPSLPSLRQAVQELFVRAKTSGSD